MLKKNLPGAKNIAGSFVSMQSFKNFVRYFKLRTILPSF
jgi:hypothetical protein